MQPMTHRESQRGQAMVEFALIAPVFFLLLFGVIQMGILFGGQIGLVNAAREVARYASTVPAGASAGTITTQANAVLGRSIPANNGGAVTTVAYCSYQNPTSPVTYSQKVTITIRYGHSLFIPLVGAIIDRIDGTADNRFTVTAREEMKVETLPAKTDPSPSSPCGANP